MVEITELMTPNPVCVPATTTIADAARRMRDDDIGDVLVMDGGRVCGILTDRDIVIRAIAGGLDPDTTTAAECASTELVTVSPRDKLDHAVRLMRDCALRRIPVVDDGKPIGMLTIGDVAIDREPASVLADVSGAPPNH
jgi:CBS domain-containing protein